MTKQVLRHLRVKSIDELKQRIELPSRSQRKPDPVPLELWHRTVVHHERYFMSFLLVSCISHVIH
ncbi:hypothetical protein ACT8ZS_09115 [Paenibacillus sp. M.A.Huq-84]